MKNNRGDIMFFSRPAGVRYVDRGDIVDIDFNVPDYTRDGLWHDLDLSGIIDKGTKLVLIRMGIKCNAAGKWIKFRQKGYENNANVAMLFTQVSLKDFDADILVRPDINGVIQYCIEPDTWGSLTTVIRGWFV